MIIQNSQNLKIRLQFAYIWSMLVAVGNGISKWISEQGRSTIVECPFLLHDKLKTISA